MAAENTITLMKDWYPKGIDFISVHDPCDQPTARYDIWVMLPPVHKRSHLQHYVSLRNVIQKARMTWVWRDKSYAQGERKKYVVHDRLLLISMKYLGADQFLYDRPDTWPCFWKGVETASIGWNDFTTTFTLENKNTFLEKLGPSTFPDSQLLRQNNCGTPYGIDTTTFNVEAWLFQRVYSPWFGSDLTGALFAKGNTDVAKTWAACRFWFDTHTYGFARTLDFIKDTPVQITAEKLGIEVPTVPMAYNTGKGGRGGENETWNFQFLIAPVTNETGGMNPEGVWTVPPRKHPSAPP